MKLDWYAVQDILKMEESESIVITGQLTNGTWFGSQDRIGVIKKQHVS